MVVHEDQRGGTQIQRAADHLAGVDRGLVNRTIANVLIMDQHVLRVEIKHPDPLYRQMRHVDMEIVDQRLPAAQHRCLTHHLPGKAAGGKGHDLERRRARLAHPGMQGQRARIGVQDTRQTAKTPQQSARQRFYIAARDRGHQQIFDHLMIGQSLGPAVQHPGAKPGAMAFCIIGRLVQFRLCFRH